MERSDDKWHARRGAARGKQTGHRRVQWSEAMDDIKFAALNPRAKLLPGHMLEIWVS